MKTAITAITLIIITVAVCPATTPGGDGPRPRTSLWSGFLGEGSLLSLNYERLAINTKYLFLAGGAGAGYNTLFSQCTVEPCETDQPDYLTLPHHISLCAGTGMHYLEAGFGGTVVFGNTDRHYITYPYAGYRLHPRNSRKLLLRVTFSYPTNSDVGSILYVPWGVSIGMSF